MISSTIITWRSPVSALTFNSTSIPPPTLAATHNAIVNLPLLAIVCLVVWLSGCLSVCLAGRAGRGSSHPEPLARSHHHDRGGPLQLGEQRPSPGLLQYPGLEQAAPIGGYQSEGSPHNGGGGVAGSKVSKVRPRQAAAAEAERERVPQPRQPNRPIFRLTRTPPPL